MTLEKRFLLNKEINKLREDITRLSSMVDNALEQAMLALINRDVALAQSVIAADTHVNRLRYDIEQECLRVLATQGPMAGDLRTIITVTHLAVELERIGDHAAGIARVVARMENEPEIVALHKLPKMAKRARNMVQDAIKTFLDRDTTTAQELIKRDDKLDKRYQQLFSETIQEMSDDNYIRRATYLLWVGHNLERVGDRATNIAERVIFMTTGEFIEIKTELDLQKQHPTPDPVLLPPVEPVVTETAETPPDTPI